MVNSLAVFDGIAQNSVYQGICGWTNRIMTLSWGTVCTSLVYYGTNLAATGILSQHWDAAKIDRFYIDWKTGTIVMSGGLVGQTPLIWGNSWS